MAAGPIRVPRRFFLASALSLPLPAQQKSRVAGVRVRDVEVHRVRVNQRGNWILPRMTASNGATGIADASHGGSDESKLEHLKHFTAMFRDARITDIERLRQAADADIRRGGTAAAVAFSSLETCLWDILGKTLEVPLYELFGGRLRSGIRNYANINRSTPERTPEGFARMAEQAVKAGFDAVKLAPFDDIPRNPTPEQFRQGTDHGVACAEAVRQAIGPERSLLIDAHSRFDVESGIELARRLEPLDLFWLEEVTPAKEYQQLAAINRAARMPTAGGEAAFAVDGFLPYIRAGSVDIAMPDVKYCGGMLELKKIGAMCEGAKMPVSPHGPASPVGNVAAAHVCAGMPNFLILEFSYGEVPWRSELIDPPEALRAGVLEWNDAPGLGIELNQRTLARYRI